MLRLYNRLETTINAVQENIVSRTYLTKKWRGFTICIENQKGAMLKQISLSKAEGKILNGCDDITNLTDIRDSVGTGDPEFTTVLNKMEQQGWIARSADQVVRTVPFSSFGHRMKHQYRRVI